MKIMSVVFIVFSITQAVALEENREFEVLEKAFGPISGGNNEILEDNLSIMKNITGIKINCGNITTNFNSFDTTYTDMALSGRHRSNNLGSRVSAYIPESTTTVGPFDTTYTDMALSGRHRSNNLGSRVSAYIPESTTTVGPFDTTYTDMALSGRHRSNNLGSRVSAYIPESTTTVGPFDTTYTDMALSGRHRSNNLGSRVSAYIPESTLTPAHIQYHNNMKMLCSRSSLHIRF